MASLQIETPPVCEPVALADAKNFLRVTIPDDDSLISGLIAAAREYCETFTARSFINKGYLQCLDSFPYFTDTMMSQAAYPPSYYSLPRYSTTLWNYSQMIKLFYSMLAQAATISYVSSVTSAFETLTGTTDVSDEDADFLCDVESEPPRLFPNAGQNWPACLFVPNAVQIHYVAGYNNETAIATAVAAWKAANSGWTQAQATAYESTERQADVPQTVKLAIMQLVAHWYENREAASALQLREAPNHVTALLWSERVLDLQPTRG
jgi:hypothetical protein